MMMVCCGKRVVTRPLRCSSQICCSEQRELRKGSLLLLDLCLRPQRTSTSRHRGYAQRHTFRFANCKVREINLEAIQGALKIQERHSQTQWLFPQISTSQSKDLCVAQQCQPR